MGRIPVVPSSRCWRMPSRQDWSNTWIWNTPFFSSGSEIMHLYSAPLLENPDIFRVNQCAWAIFGPEARLTANVFTYSKTFWSWTSKRKSFEILPYTFSDILTVGISDKSKTATLIGNSPWGILRGLETFSQMMYEITDKLVSDRLLIY